MGIQAIIFDLDGVLIDSEPVGIEIAQNLLTDAGVSISPKELLAFVGVPDRQFYSEIASLNDHLDATSLLAKHTHIYESSLDNIPVISGAIEAVKRCYQFAPLALVSGSTRTQIERVLKRLGLREAFKEIISADDVKLGKPDPHGFKRAARKLGVQEIACVVIEDSPSGLQAAQEAGMCRIEYNPSSTERGIQNGCTTVASLNEITEGLLTQLLHSHKSIGISLRFESGWQSTAQEFGKKLRSEDYLFKTDPFDPWSIFKHSRDNSLYRLLAAGHSISESLLQPLLGTDLIMALSGTGLLRRLGDDFQSVGRVVGSFGQLLLIDQPISSGRGLWHSAKTYLDDSTINYVSSLRLLIEPVTGKSVLEIGPGSGLACILFAQAGASSVLGLDIDQAAVELSRFNAALNGVLENIEFERSDLFDYLNASTRRFDLITFHPPYRIVPPDLPYPNPTQRIGPTEDGLGLVRRFIQELPSRIADGGRALVSVQLPQYRDSQKRWELDSLAVQHGLALNIFDIGDEISVDEAGRSIAAKLGHRVEIEQRVREYYQELGISSLRPALLVVSKAQER